MRSRVYPFKISLAANGDDYQKVTSEKLWFAFKKITGISDGNFEARYLPDGKPMSKFRSPKANIIGVAQYPFIQTAWAYMAPKSPLFVDIKDLSAAPNDIEIDFVGVEGTEREIKSLISDLNAWPFWFPGEIVVPAGDTRTLLIDTDEGATFRMIKLIAESTGTFNANITGGPLALARNKVSNLALFGNAQRPLVIDPWDVPGGLPIEIEITDTSGAQNTIKVNPVGHKIIGTSIRARR